MATTNSPAQHNDSVSTGRKRADQGPVLHDKGSAPHNPHIGRGHDERGTYGRGRPGPDRDDRPSQTSGT